VGDLPAIISPTDQTIAAERCTLSVNRKIDQQPFGIRNPTNFPATDFICQYRCPTDCRYNWVP